MRGRNVFRGLKVDNFSGTVNHRVVAESNEENFRYGVKRTFVEVLVGVERYLEQLRIQKKWSDVPVSFGASHIDMLKEHRTEIKKLGLLDIAVKLARLEYVEDTELFAELKYRSFHTEGLPLRAKIRVLKSARKAAMHIIK